MDAPSGYLIGQLVLPLMVGFAFALICGCIAAMKGRKLAPWILCGFLLGPIGLIIIFFTNGGSGTLAERERERERDNVRPW